MVKYSNKQINTHKTHFIELIMLLIDIYLASSA